MLRGAWRGGRGRRGAMVGASAALLCLGGLLAACGGDGRDGYVATGAAGDGPEKGPGGAVAPRGDVEYVPLDGEPSGKPSGASPDGPGGKPSQEGGSGGGESTDPEGGGNSPESGGGSGEPASPDSKSPDGSGSSSSPDAPDSSPPSRDGDDDNGTRPSAPGDVRPRPPEKPGTSAPPRPAALKVGDPRRRPAEKRWCEDVTLSFRNTGGSPVRSGSVTLGTHIIGALGVDWGTIEATRKLPAPIGAGKTVKKTWPICVDWWRVPLGMHIETRDVDVDWK
ncbi:hypothetical protein [Streptomyces lasiicapitis]|uniref:hypothetical protein n=1 Tax=Streptomyces lasiicapitis TaxID=1923961 RepID=UPI0036C832AC